MEVDAPAASASDSGENPLPCKWRWRLLSFTLLPGMVGRQDSAICAD